MEAKTIIKFAAAKQKGPSVYPALAGMGLAGTAVGGAGTVYYRGGRKQEKAAHKATSEAAREWANKSRTVYQADVAAAGAPKYKKGYAAAENKAKRKVKSTFKGLVPEYKQLLRDMKVQGLGREAKQVRTLLGKIIKGAL